MSEQMAPVPSQRRYVVRDLAGGDEQYHDGSIYYWSRYQREAKRYTLAEARALRDDWQHDPEYSRVVVRRLVSRAEAVERARREARAEALEEVDRLIRERLDRGDFERARCRPRDGLGWADEVRALAAKGEK